MYCRCIVLRVIQYFGEPEGRVKIQIMSKNIQRYYTLKCYVKAGEFRGYLFAGNASQKYAKRNGIGAEYPAN